MNYDKVGQARKGACILSNLLTRFDARFIEAPFADENTPNSAITHGEVSSPCLALNFGVQNSRFILNKGVFCPHSTKNSDDQTLTVGVEWGLRSSLASEVRTDIFTI